MELKDLVLRVKEDVFDELGVKVSQLSLQITEKDGEPYRLYIYGGMERTKKVKYKFGVHANLTAADGTILDKLLDVPSHTMTLSYESFSLGCYVEHLPAIIPEGSYFELYPDSVEPKSVDSDDFDAFDDEDNHEED